MDYLRTDVQNRVATLTLTIPPAATRSTPP